jgi:hypothetical protein
MWKRVVACVLLSGCSSLMGVSPTVDFQIIVAAIQSCDVPPSTMNVANATTAMEVGFTQVKSACEAFFVEATRIQQNALAADKGLDAGLVGLSSVLNATASTSAALKTITITQAGVVLTKALIDDYSTVYTFNTYLYKVRDFVGASMQKYIDQARANPPENYCIAYTYISDLARLCSLAAMKANLDMHIAVAPSAITSGERPPSGQQQRHAIRSFSSTGGGQPSGSRPSGYYTVVPPR